MAKWKRVISRVCPGCGYLIAECQIRRARFDYSCPRCKTRKLSEFEIAQTEMMESE